MMPGTDLLLIMCVVSLATALFVFIFNKTFIGWDVRFLNWFSEAAQSPKWFVVWVLVLLGWIPLRELLIEKNLWFKGDGDILLMTFLWSVVPFMVENAMKYSTAKQMNAITEQNALIAAQTQKITEQNGQIKELAGAIRQQLAESKETQEVTIVLVQRLLDAIEEEEED